MGHPITHSLSPFLHGRWLKQFGFEGVFERIDPGDEDGFRQFVETDLTKYRGVCVTLPFKGLAIEVSDAKTSRADQIGTANVLVWRNGRLTADNTDGPGFLAALGGSGFAAKRGAKARLLGAGGAAPAIAWALREAGIDDLEVCNRTKGKASDLAFRFGGEAVDWSMKDDGISDLDILVNATSLGLPGGPPLDFPVEALPATALVCDIVPAREETPLVTTARLRGLRIMDGLPMLVHQAMPAFEAFFGMRPSDADAALRDLRAHLT